MDFLKYKKVNDQLLEQRMTIKIVQKFVKWFLTQRNKSYANVNLFQFLNCFNSLKIVFPLLDTL